MTDPINVPIEPARVVDDRVTDQRKLELRFKVWALAQDVLTDTANTRASMPFLINDEYEYARTFMLQIAKRTRPGEYRDDAESSGAQEKYPVTLKAETEHGQTWEELAKSVQQLRTIIDQLTCKTCGFLRGGLHDYKCRCDMTPQKEGQ